MLQHYKSPMRYLSAAFILSLAAAAQAVGAQQSVSVPVQPAGAWTIDYADNGCDLSRDFGSGDTSVKVTLSLGLTPLEADVSLRGVAAPTIENANRASLASANDLVETIFFSQVPRPTASDPFASGKFPTLLPFSTPGTDVILTFHRGRRPLLSLNMTNLAAGLAALRTCQDDLYQAAGIDAQAMRRITVDAQPATSEPTWATTDDLPEQFRDMSGSLLATMRLNVDAEGRVSNCTVVGSTGHQLLDFQSCRVLMARARYSPARDADGNAVPTIKMKRIRWQGPS